MMEDGRTGPRPTAEEVIARLKDDGDFDTLRLKIISKVKENVKFSLDHHFTIRVLTLTARWEWRAAGESRGRREARAAASGKRRAAVGGEEDLRNSIITEVKQSQILNQDGSENLKPRQLSDAIYQELGKKIMGRISDEVWKVIRGGDTKDAIKGTVESVYDRIVNPKPKEEDHRSSSPAKDNLSKQKGVSPTRPPAHELDMPDVPPDFAPSNQQANKAENDEEHHDQLPPLPAEKEHYDPTNMLDDDDDMPPGFAVPVSSVGAVKVSPSNVMNNTGGACAAMPQGLETGGDVAADMPPGFSINGVGAHSFGAMPPGFGGAGVAADDDDDDLDVPPGFG